MNFVIISEIGQAEEYNYCAHAYVLIGLFVIFLLRVKGPLKLWM